MTALETRTATHPVGFRESACRIEDFVALVEQHCDPVDYPNAVVIYDPAQRYRDGRRS